MPGESPPSHPEQGLGVCATGHGDKWGQRPVQKDLTRSDQPEGLRLQGCLTGAVPNTPKLLILSAQIWKADESWGPLDEYPRICGAPSPCLEGKRPRPLLERALGSVGRREERNRAPELQPPAAGSPHPTLRVSLKPVWTQGSCCPAQGTGPGAPEWTEEKAPGLRVAPRLSTAPALSDLTLERELSTGCAAAAAAARGLGAEALTGRGTPRNVWQETG